METIYVKSLQFWSCVYSWQARAVALMACWLPLLAQYAHGLAELHGPCFCSLCAPFTVSMFGNGSNAFQPEASLQVGPTPLQHCWLYEPFDTAIKVSGFMA